MARQIALTQGKFALVDDEDFEELNNKKWYAIKSNRTFYAYSGKCAAMHRVIMNPPNDMVVDHIDGDGLNNTRNNLRICTQTENKWNNRKSVTNKSGAKGVYFFAKKWQASIGDRGKTKYLGRFNTPEEAEAAYKKAARELRGEFAN